MEISTHKLSLSPQKNPKTTPFPPSITTVTENDDLLTTILSLLPTKSVTRFKSVSKHWLSLLSLSSFSLLHASNSPPQPPSSLLFPLPNNNSLFHSIPLKPTICTSTPSTSNNITNDPSTSLSFTNDPSGEIEIVQSCNGLLLCSSGSPWDGIDTRVFYIYNPTTKQFNTLPPPPNPTTRHVSLLMFTKINLAFDPSKSPYYKVVLVRKSDGGTGFFRVDIFCSKIKAWRACGGRVEWPCFEVFCKGVFVNGAVHWGSKRDGFLCFDVENECFKLMPLLPEFRAGNSTIRYFGESGGKLYLVDARGLEFDVFEMERDYSGWVPKFQVDLGRVFGSYPCLFSIPLCDFCIEKGNISLISVVSEGDDKGDLCLILHVPGKILSYNLKSEGLKVIRDGILGKVERMIPALVKGFGGYQHFESLACVDCTIKIKGLVSMMKEKRPHKHLEEGSDILSWVNKSRKLDEKRISAKEKALRLSKAFEEQDDINQREAEVDIAATHSPRDLAGVKVFHGLDKVIEGGAVVLTLKDHSILADGYINEDILR